MMRRPPRADRMPRLSAWVFESCRFGAADRLDKQDTTPTTIASASCRLNAATSCSCLHNIARFPLRRGRTHYRPEIRGAVGTLERAGTGFCFARRNKTGKFKRLWIFEIVKV